MTTRKQIFGRKSWALTAALLTGTLLSALAVSRFVAAENDIEVKSQELKRALLSLGRSIGYGGFIHNFKNYVLRPDEDIYLTEALGNLETAFTTIDEIAEISDELGVGIRLDAARSTLAEYRAALDVARASRVRGDSVRETDALVRVSDKAAEFDLLVLDEKLQAWFSARAEVAIKTRNRLMAGLLVLMALVLAYAVKSSIRARNQERIAFSETLIAREKEHSQQLEDQIAQLARANHRLKEFSHLAAYDLKEPNRGIKINTYFLREAGLPEPALTRLDRIEFLVDRMDQMISELLEYARLGVNEREVQNVNVAEQIGIIEGEIFELIAETKTELVVEPSLPLVRAHQAKIRVIFRNLIVNGIRYNESEQKRITIGFDKAPSAPGLEGAGAFFVKDNGIGMTAEQQERAFGMFTRLNPDARFGPSSGSGLPFIRSAAESYGGKTVMVSEPDKGTCVFIQVPLQERT